MSIAVSAVVKPSRILFGMLIIMCIGVLFVGIVVGAGSVGNLADWSRVTLLVLCAVVAGFAFYRAMAGRRNRYEIHVSGSGQIRLSVLIKDRHHGAGNENTVRTEAVRLLPVSTLWSGLLLLHLQGENKRIEVLVILPDSVSRESFRALLVACRWIVMRHPDADCESTIRN